MNILGILLGATLLKGGSSSEVNAVKKQLPQEEREAFLQQYKQLDGQAKSDFKAALKNADLAAASQIIGKDLTKYNISLNKKEPVSAGDANTLALQTQSPLDAQPNSDFAARINKILAVPTSINPELVAEAAKRYEAAVPLADRGNISDKTKKLIELKG